jgi:nickel/cobalt exporter
MLSASIFSVLLLGFSSGVIHAFDADHLAAVGGLSGRDQGRRSYQFALHWGFGHGLAVIIIASAVYLLGAAIPVKFSMFAEALVGWMLIVVGALTFYHLWQQHHRHDTNQSNHPHALWIGLIHGSAGSATLLAVMPALGLANPALGMMHVMIFNVGLILAMALVGVTVRGGLSAAGRYHDLMRLFLQSIFASFAVGFGIFRLLS